MEEVSDRTTRLEQQQRVAERRTGEYFWRHIRHTASNAGMQPAFRVMNRHIKVGEMNVSVGIQDDVVRLDITARRNQWVVSIYNENPFG